jgi:hypothetical protein
MADVTTKSVHRVIKGVRRSKKLSTNVDLTPMVDLGFLLITFFIFTTSLAEPKAMQLFLPAGETATMPWGESAALTIIPIGSDRVFYYHGALKDAMLSKQYGTTGFTVTNGIGDVIRKKQNALAAGASFKKDDLLLIIKPSANASYQNVTDALDEVIINALKHYSLVDMDAAEVVELKKRGLL